MLLLKMALIVIMIGIIFFAGLLGKRLDEMNECIIEIWRITMELKEKIEKGEDE